jgi:hypothetical protein
MPSQATGQWVTSIILALWLAFCNFSKSKWKVESLVGQTKTNTPGSSGMCGSTSNDPKQTVPRDGGTPPMRAKHPQAVGRNFSTTREKNGDPVSTSLRQAVRPRSPPALKFLPDDVASDPQALARFQREAHRLPHSTVIPRPYPQRAVGSRLIRLTFKFK